MTTTAHPSTLLFLRAKHWWVLFIAALVALLVVSALAVIYAKYEVRVLNVELQALKQEKLMMDTERQQLQIEQGMLTAHGMVEKTARTDLGMVLPASQQVIVVRP